MTKKTYGVSGLIDWKTTIKAGGARLNIHFSGGALTKYGIVPAEYTTTDPVIQRIIENSEHYRSGRISMLRHSSNQDEKHPDDTKVLKEIYVANLNDAKDKALEDYNITDPRILSLEEINEAVKPLGVVFKVLNNAKNNEPTD